MHRIIAPAAALILGIGTAQAQIPDVVKVGVLTDMSGPFSDQDGPGGVVAAQMAAEDFAKEGGGFEVEIVSADHQNKPDTGASIARRWVDEEGVDAITGVPNSAVGFAVNTVLHDKNRTFLATGTVSSDLTGPHCQPTTVQWVADTWSLANAETRAVVQAGGRSWYFISYDYALGKALVRDASSILQSLGGTVVGDTTHPIGASDFSSYLLQAQSSGAQVLGLADTGTDAISAVKQAGEFGLTGQMTVAGLFMQLPSIEAIGLRQAQGLIVSEAFYWDLNDKTRNFARRFMERMHGRAPTEDQAGDYSVTLEYLRAVKAAGTVAGDRVVAQLRSAPIDDPLFGRVVVRPDGRATHEMFVFRVKKPEQSHGPWDLYQLIATIPADQAFRPLDQGGCKLVSGDSKQR